MWDFDGDYYDLSMFFVEDDGKSENAKANVMRSRYYAVSPNKVAVLMKEAGFSDVERIDGPYYQPVLIGKKCSIRSY